MEAEATTVMEHFKCARCKHEFTADDFWLNRKGERSKTCKTCNEQKVAWAKKKRDAKFDGELDHEQWKQHPTYTDYWASKSGNIYNVKMRKMIGAFLNDGYVQVALRIPQTRLMYAHRFVWETFNGAIPDDKVINHINEIKDDNRLENLELVSHSENSAKSTHKAEGRRKPRACIGHLEGNDAEQSFKSLSDARRKTGCPQPCIQKVCEGITNSTKSKTTGDAWLFRYSN